MKTNVLRQMWKIVLENASLSLLELDDTQLISQLLQEAVMRHPLNHDDYHCLKAYLNSRTPLIRDLIMAA